MLVLGHPIPQHAVLTTGEADASIPDIVIPRTSVVDVRRETLEHARLRGEPRQRFGRRFGRFRVIEAKCWFRRKDSNFRFRVQGSECLASTLREYIYRCLGCCHPKLC